MSPNVMLALTNNKERLLKFPNVVGVGIGRKVVDGRHAGGEETVTVMVERKLPYTVLSADGVIPLYLPTGKYDAYALAEHVPTDVIQVGRVMALPTAQEKQPTDKWRPAPGGVSIGHYAITAGTLGCVAKTKYSGQRVILSNNHVLADTNEGVPGDAILQPGPYDGGGVVGDMIGVLGQYIRIDFGEDEPLCPYAERFVQVSNKLASVLGSKHRVRAYQANPQAINYVDAAIAIPTNDGDVLDIIWGGIGIIDGISQGYIGMEVSKYGRTTRFTNGSIQLSNATVMVGYGGNKVARFDNQFVTGGDMSAGGDSGSIVVEKGTTKAVGLLFAGSDQSTIFSPIDAVLNALELEF